MESFTKTINSVDFTFNGFLEGNDEVCRVSVEGQHNFWMTIAEVGGWEI